jgi:hypothetical protein
MSMPQILINPFNIPKSVIKDCCRCGAHHEAGGKGKLGYRGEIYEVSEV